MVAATLGGLVTVVKFESAGLGVGHDGRYGIVCDSACRGSRPCLSETTLDVISSGYVEWIETESPRRR